MDEQIRNALKGKKVVIDITTTGRRSGQPRRVEIWFHNIDGRIIITGTPGPRSWLANLAANPDFTFHLKGTVRADLPARARLITDPDERRAIMSAPETGWYRDQVGGIEPLVKGSPMLEVEFTDTTIRLL
jgi:deazaflavin-dependent oxidoreductase (nitroreductase family)